MRKVNPKIIHSHSYDPTILNVGGWALDLGCNDFVMVRHLLSLGLKVIGVEPIKNLQVPFDLQSNTNFILINKACVGIKKTNTAIYYEYQAWGANSLCNSPELLHRPENFGHAKNPFKTSYDVELITIEEIMKTYDIVQFEYIKIDIEGSEYDILENLPKKCTKQFSVEFHDFLDLTPIKDVELYHAKLNEKLGDYLVVYQDVEPLRGMSKTQLQRNDVLYVLNSLL